MSRKAPEPPGLAVGWKWLAGILTSVVLLGGAGWMTSTSSDNRELRVELAQVKEAIAEKGADMRVLQKDVESIRDSQKRTEETIKDIRKEQQENIKDLKQLLQDEKFRSRPRAN